MLSKWMAPLLAGATLCLVAPVLAAPAAPAPMAMKAAAPAAKPAAAAAKTGHSVAPDAFGHWTDKELAAVLVKPHLHNMLSDHENYFVEDLVRDTSGGVEQHQYWIDFFVIQEGTGTLIYGGQPVGGKVDPVTGELRGAKSIVGGQSVALVPGEVVEIPAGHPHQVLLKPGTTIRYIVFKERQ